jgi:hypothetical protein
MTDRFKTAVFEKDGSWWFKWWNVSFEAPSAPGAPLSQDVIRCKDKQAAESERQKFVEAETRKRPGVLFESA